MKLTEDDFDIMEPAEYYWTEGNMLSIGTYPEDNKKLNQVKQQILENQKIVERVRGWFKDSKYRQGQIPKWLLQSILGEQK